MYQQAGLGWCNSSSTVCFLFMALPADKHLTVDMHGLFATLDTGYDAAKEALGQQSTLFTSGLACAASECGPWVVADDIPVAVYDAWATSKDCNWKLAFLPTSSLDSKGTVVIYGDATEVHEAVALFVGREIHKQLEKLGGADADDHLVPLGSSSFVLANGERKAADASFRPLLSEFGLTPPGRLPTLVLEVAHCNETLEKLREEVDQWALNGAHAIGIKIGPGSEPSMWCCWASLNDDGTLEQLEVQFGCDSECEESGTHLLHIPLSSLFKGYQLPSEFESAEDCVELDLYKIQRVARRHLAQPLISISN